MTPSQDVVEHDLAIVIPAYKADFFATALESLAHQTDQRFRVYVGDDASPSNLRIICDQFEGSLNLRYHRFAENLGARSLAAHWTRCVRLATEPWVWLFSDDDVLDPGCVEAFHREIASAVKPHDLYHFNTAIIDAAGSVLRVTRPFAELVSASDYAANRLVFQYSSFAAEYIFSRQAFEREGGFVEFPVAWCSDDASWVAFCGIRGIRTIEGPLVRWRASGRNITSAGSPFVDEKVRAMLAYLHWLNQRLGANASGLTPRGGVGIRSLYTPWFFAMLSPINPRLGVRRCWAIAQELGARSGISAWRMFIPLARNELSALRSSMKVAALRWLGLGITKRF